MLNLKRTCNWKIPQREKYPNTDRGKYGPEITPYLDTFHAVSIQFKSLISLKNQKTFWTRKILETRFCSVSIKYRNS